MAPQNPITPGVYSVRKIYDKNFDYRITQTEKPKLVINDFNEISEDFNKNLNELVSDVFNPEISFTQTEETKNCEYCAFSKICHR
jgi:PD-(D/E)XK nuclease superfamily protein